MPFTHEQLLKLCQDALQKAHETLESLGEAGVSEVHDGHVVDISTRGDRAVSDALISFFRQEKIPSVLYSEESGRVELGVNPEYTITFDDIDGTDNYFRGRGVLPYCTVVTIFDSAEPKFKDAVVVGVLEHNSGTLWHAVRDRGCFLNGRKVDASGRKSLDKKTLVVIDHYIDGERVSLFEKIHARAWVKDFGCAALHMAGVGSGLFDAYLSTFQKAHELGAGYLLVKESNRFVSGLDGKPLDGLKYDFDAKYPVVMASTPELAKELLSILGQHGKF